MRTDKKVIPMRPLLNDCFLTDKDRLPHHEAIEILKSRLPVIVKTESIPLKEATGRVLAETITASRNIPSTDNSAVDGYAYHSGSYDATGGYFPVIARIAAGDTQRIEIPEFGAARIFTGAIMPQGVDTIAMQEDCEPHEQDGAHFVAIPSGLKPGANRRKAGEDLKIGDIIASTGEVLTPQRIAAIAATGKAEIEVYAPLKVAILSNGDELREPGEVAENGQSYDSNRFLLQSLLSNLPIEITDLGILPDSYEEIERELAKAANTHDIVVSSGGASQGEEDYAVMALEKLGTRHLWQLAVKPGRPMSFGNIGDCAFFGLPGNPVACFVCFLLYVRPSLLQLAGAIWLEPKRYLVPSGFAYAGKKPDRREFWRGFYLNDETGKPFLEKFARDGSGLITGLRVSDGLIEIPEEATSINKGDLLSFIPWSEFGL